MIMSKAWIVGNIFFNVNHHTHLLIFFFTQIYLITNTHVTFYLPKTILTIVIKKRKTQNTKNKDSQIPVKS